MYRGEPPFGVIYVAPEMRVYEHRNTAILVTLGMEILAIINYLGTKLIKWDKLLEVINTHPQSHLES